MSRDLLVQMAYYNISFTEFSNVSEHFMEDVNTCYGGRKHTTNGFLFLLLNYSRPSQNGHLSIRTPTLRTVSNVSTKFLYIFFKQNLYNTDSL